MKPFVLVGDEQVPVSPQDVVGSVKERGWKRTAEYYGIGQSTLRRFVAENRFIVQTVFVRLPESTEIAMTIPGPLKEDSSDETQELPSVG